jgi:hypothetical protein
MGQKNSCFRYILWLGEGISPYVNHELLLFKPNYYGIQGEILDHIIGYYIIYIVQETEG